MLTKRKMLAGLAVLGLAIPTGLAAVTMATPAQAALPASLPVTFTNNSGRSEQVYLYVMGQSLTSNQLGYGDSAGNFHAWGGGSLPPSPAPDVAITGPANGQSMTFRIPKLSGRVYFSYGAKLKFFLVPTPNGTGLVQPDPVNPSDPNVNTLFDWSEYTYNDAGIWLNSSQVDMLSIPHAVGVKKSDGTTISTGRMVAGGRNSFFGALAGQPGGWANLAVMRSGWPLRALSPLKGIQAGKLPANIIDSYISQAWSTYASKTLTVQPFGDQPNTKYFGRTSGNTMNFTNSSGAVVTSFNKPTSADVFGCAGNLDAPNDLVRGPISRTLCAALNRGTLAAVATQPDNNAADFYKVTACNQYARKIHARMVDGKAYAFAFDDVGNFEALVHDGAPQQAYITIDSLA
ncbi:MAG: sugar hydrolase [Actinomycetia bacterium]|nr:sugar hydrolase [Actinomycetes bacterium]MDQ1654965.1 hypothetical protein [Cryptosporangiaceae bacterium]